jgi:hypothetical protein
LGGKLSGVARSGFGRATAERAAAEPAIADAGKMRILSSSPFSKKQWKKLA